MIAWKTVPQNDIEWSLTREAWQQLFSEWDAPMNSQILDRLVASALRIIMKKTQANSEHALRGNERKQFEIQQKWEHFQQDHIWITMSHMLQWQIIYHISIALRTPRLSRDLIEGVWVMVKNDDHILPGAFWEAIRWNIWMNKATFMSFWNSVQLDHPEWFYNTNGNGRISWVLRRDSREAFFTLLREREWKHVRRIKAEESDRGKSPKDDTLVPTGYDRASWHSELYPLALDFRWRKQGGFDFESRE